MKLKLIIIVLSILLIASIILSLFEYNHIKQSKEILKINTYISETIRQVEYLKKHPPITIEKFIKLSDQEKTQAYKELLTNYNLTLELLEKTIKKLENEAKLHERANKALARKDFFFISGIAGIGFDQEWNLLAQAGFTLNGKVYDGKILPIKIYIGGGATYLIRSNFIDTTNGVNLIFQTTFLIGK